MAWTLETVSSTASDSMDMDIAGSVSSIGMVTVDSAFVSVQKRGEGKKPLQGLFKSPPRNGRRFKGVRHRKWGKFVCEIRDAIGKRIWLGSYTCEEEAARVYDMAARILQGEGAWLNFPEEESQTVTLPRATVNQLLKHREHTTERLMSEEQKTSQGQSASSAKDLAAQAQERKTQMSGCTEAVPEMTENFAPVVPEFVEADLGRCPSFGWQCFLDDLASLAQPSETSLNCSSVGDEASDEVTGALNLESLETLKWPCQEISSTFQEKEDTLWSPTCLWYHEDLGTVDIIMNQ